MNKLTVLVKDFVYRVGIIQGLSELDARKAGGKIFTFGSYKLGVHGTGRMRVDKMNNVFLIFFLLISLGADIDTLCVFPKHVEREHFFTIMYNMLNERAEVSELTVKIWILTVCLSKILNSFCLVCRRCICSSD